MPRLGSEASPVAANTGGGVAANTNFLVRVWQQIRGGVAANTGGVWQQIRGGAEVPPPNHHQRPMAVPFFSSTFLRKPMPYRGLSTLRRKSRRNMLKLS